MYKGMQGTYSRVQIMDYNFIQSEAPDKILIPIFVLEGKEQKCNKYGFYTQLFFHQTWKNKDMTVPNIIRDLLNLCQVSIYG